MDRVTAYFGALVQETDVLKPQQNAMVGLGWEAQAFLGTATAVDGFTCTPTAPASLNVILTPGAVYQLENLEASTWSSLPANTSQSVIKQGLMQLPDTISITPPTTVGYSQVYLIEVQYADLDTNPVLLPYFNASNPSQPFSGPANSGQSQNTARLGIAAVQIKAGTAAPTGTQTAPTADAGWTGLFLITVAYGQTTITSGNITRLASAPFIDSGAKLPQIPFSILNSRWSFVQDFGSVNHISGTLAENVTSYQLGMRVVVKAAFAPTGPTVANFNQLGNVSIINPDLSPVINSQWVAGSILELCHDGTSFQVTSISSAPQVVLQAPRTYYVNSLTGLDSNNGLTPSTAFQTLQKAVNVISLFNLNGFSVTVIVADGTYAPVSLLRTSGSGSVQFFGNVLTPANCVINGLGLSRSCIQASNCGSSYSFNGFTVQCSGTYSGIDAICGVNVTGTGTSVSILNFNFGVCQGAHVFAGQNSTVAYGGIMTVVGGCSGNAAVNGSHIFAYGNATIQNNVSDAPVLNVPAPVTLAGDWILSAFASFTQIVYTQITGAGNVTGTKYNVSGNAIISSNGGGASYYPGNLAGSSATGGQYV